MPVSAFDLHFETIVARVALGETVTAVLRALGLPSKSAFDAHLRRHTGLRSRLDAARPLSGQALVRARFEEILAAIRNGSTAEGAVEKFGGTGASFFKVVKANPELRARFVAATAEREDSDKPIGKAATGRWSDEDFDKALNALRAAPKLGFKRALIDGLPTPFLVLDKARRDPAFRERLAEVVGERAKRRVGLKRSPPRQYATGLLRRALMALDVYRQADAAVGGLDPADRDDAISEIIVAILDGKIGEAEIGTKGRRLARRRVLGERWHAASLDATAHDTQNAETIGDMIANDDQIFFY